MGFKPDTRRQTVSSVWVQADKHLKISNFSIVQIMLNKNPSLSPITYLINKKM